EMCMRPVGLKARVRGSKISAVAPPALPRLQPASVQPPATRTRPSARRVEVWTARGTAIEPTWISRRPEAAVGSGDGAGDEATGPDAQAVLNSAAATSAPTRMARMLAASFLVGMAGVAEGDPVPHHRRPAQQP